MIFHSLRFKTERFIYLYTLQMAWSCYIFRKERKKNKNEKSSKINLTQSVQPASEQPVPFTATEFKFIFRLH